MTQLGFDKFRRLPCSAVKSSILRVCITDLSCLAGLQQVGTCLLRAGHQHWRLLRQALQLGACWPLSTPFLQERLGMLPSSYQSSPLPALSSSSVHSLHCRAGCSAPGPGSTCPCKACSRCASRQLPCRPPRQGLLGHRPGSCNCQAGLAPAQQLGRGSPGYRRRCHMRPLLREGAASGCRVRARAWQPSI